ncbi:MAG: hypothetical protein WDM81_17735 [Rhizomicrobium sp.]
MAVAEFVNADNIARAISPDDASGAAIAAGRAMLERLDTLLARGRDFSFETTCSGRSHAASLRRAQNEGWHGTGHRDATVLQVVDALSARDAGHAAQ